MVCEIAQTERDLVDFARLNHQRAEHHKLKRIAQRPGTACVNVVIKIQLMNVC